MPDVATIKPEPSELVLRGCSPPPLSPPGPRRFLKKSSKNSSNGEPGGSCGMAPRSPPPPLASTVWVGEILTTASITFSATSAMPSGPRADAGIEMRAVAAPRQTAIAQARRRWLTAEIAPVMSGLSPQRTENSRPPCSQTSKKYKHPRQANSRHQRPGLRQKTAPPAHDG